MNTYDMERYLGYSYVEGGARAPARDRARPRERCASVCLLRLDKTMSAPGRKCCPRRTKSCIMTAHASCQLVCWILGGHCLLLAAAALTPHTHRLALHSRSNMSASVNERARAPVVQLDDGHYARVMPHLTLPAAKWSTYNLSRSTYTNVCFGPTFQKSSPLNESARWLSKWFVLPALCQPVTSTQCRFDGSY
eukprot:COSAG02_NODE_10158_length_2006_cov_5.083610_3_plen_193_part_00